MRSAATASVTPAPLPPGVALSGAPAADAVAADDAGETPVALHKRVEETASAAIGKGYDALRGAHVSDVQGLMGRVSLDLGGKTIAVTVNVATPPLSRDTFVLMLPVPKAEVQFDPALA